MKQLVNEAKALRTLRKTPTILKAVLNGVTPEQAHTLRDGPDGWTIHYIICHLHDVEDVFTQRVRDLLAHPNPVFKVTSNEELIQRNTYDGVSYETALATFFERRLVFISLLESLADEQWLLAGTHPQQGPATLLDVAINSGLHDIDHIEQIIRCLPANP